MHEGNNSGGTCPHNVMSDSVHGYEYQSICVHGYPLASLISNVFVVSYKINQWQIGKNIIS